MLRAIDRKGNLLATAKKPYESPKLVELGTLHGVTLQTTKTGANCDLTCFHHGSMSPN